jgi:hypothetical protein
MLATLSACATSPTVPPAPIEERPALPLQPAGLGPVKVPRPELGQDPKAFAGYCIAATRQANGRLRAFGGFYDDVRREYGASSGGQAGQDGGAL